MSADVVAKGMIQKRLQDGKQPAAAYDEVIDTIQAGVDELSQQAKSLEKSLTEANEPAEYIRRRLAPFGIQIELQMFLLQAARQLKQAEWTP